MNRLVKCCCLLAGVLVGLVVCAPAASAQGLGRRYEMGELRQMVADATVLVKAKAVAEPVSKSGNESGYVWQTAFEVVQVVKGDYAGKQFALWVKSPLSDLNTSRKQIPGKEFILPLVAFEGGARNEFRPVADVAFAADSAEAATLVKIAGGDAAVITPQTQSLRLRLDPVQPPYEVGKPAPLRVTLENNSDQATTYLQAPFEVRDGQLYVLGEGNLIVTDRGVAVPMKRTVHLRTAPPSPAAPVTVRGQDKAVRQIDLAEFFDIKQPGLYMVMMVVPGPDGEVLIRSNTASVQVIAPLTAPVETATVQTPTAADSLMIPAPEAYRPGEIANGMAGLLRPAKAQFEVGEPVIVELRLANTGDRAFNVDTRLERTLSFTVRSKGDSPAVRERSQYLNWPPAKEDEHVYAYARLRPAAFWGKEVNVNSLYGRDRERMDDAAKAVLKGAMEPSYETSGMTLFAFEKPGVYRLRATYEMAPSGADGPRLWAGKLLTNPIFIRVVERADDESPAMTPE